jgi:DNA-binding GntR family transcriptional regulator
VSGKRAGQPEVAFGDKILDIVARSKYVGKMLITDYIKEDLSARLRSGQTLPTPLTIDAISEHYNVSFSPVRTAIAELIDEGLVVKGANRRLIAVPQNRRAARSAKSVKAPELPPDPFAALSSDLVKLSLNGEAIFLREEATADKYGMSRSAIRSILHRLAGEGVLDHVPRRGWRLRPFRQDDLQAFIEVREVLELKALDLARSKLVAVDLQRMLDANRLPTSSGDVPQIDETMHEYFVAKAGNSYIRDFFERQGRYYRLLFEWEDHEPEVAVETIRQHREILTTLLEKDWSSARRALSHHILENHPILGKRVADRESGR